MIKSSRRGAKTQRGEDMKWGSLGKVKEASPNRKAWWRRERKMSLVELLLVPPTTILLMFALILFIDTTFRRPTGFNSGTTVFWVLYPWVMVFFMNEGAVRKIKKRIVEIGGLEDRALLAEIATEGKDEDVRHAAAERLDKLKMLDRLDALEKQLDSEKA